MAGQPCAILVEIKSVENLPKVNKGHGGANPFVVLEVQDREGQAVVGGMREINCLSCKTKPLKRMLSGHIQESFKLNVDTEMVRRGYRLCVRVMDWRPSPQVHFEIGSSEVLLADVARMAGGSSSTPLELKSNGELVSTYGKHFKKDETIRGHHNPDAPSLVMLSVVLTTPAFKKSVIVPDADQLQAWDYFLLSPDEQVEYSKDMVNKERELVEKEARRKKAEKKMSKRNENEENTEKLLGMIRDPSSHRMNWQQLRSVVNDELLKREWGSTMDKFDGAGGWKRRDGIGSEERMVEAERLLVQKLNGYKLREQQETESIRHFVQVHNSKHLLHITNHLREYTDPGGQLSTEKYPGSRALGGSLSRILPTADISRKHVPHLSWTTGRPRASKRKQGSEAAAVLMSLDGFSHFIHALAASASRSSQLSKEHILEELTSNSRRWRLIEMSQGLWLNEHKKKQLVKIKSKMMSRESILHLRPKTSQSDTRKIELVDILKERDLNTPEHVRWNITHSLHNICRTSSSSSSISHKFSHLVEFCDQDVCNPAERSRLQTPTRYQSKTRMFLTEGLEDVARPWDVHRVNDIDFLFPSQELPRLSGFVSRPASRSYEYRATGKSLEAEGLAECIQLDHLRKTDRRVRLGTADHPYRPPADLHWHYTQKQNAGLRRNDLDNLPDLRSLSSGGSVLLHDVNENPRPDTAASVVRSKHGIPGCLTLLSHTSKHSWTSFEVEYASFGKTKAFEGRVVLKKPPSSLDSEMEEPQVLQGNIALFDVELKTYCMFNDLSMQCARSAQSAGAKAVVFVQSQDELCLAQGGDPDLEISIVSLRRRDGDQILKVLDDQLEAVEVHISVRPTLEPGKEEQASRDLLSDAHASQLSRFWQDVFEQDKDARQWLDIVCSLVYESSQEALRTDGQQPAVKTPGGMSEQRLSSADPEATEHEIHSSPRMLDGKIKRGLAIIVHFDSGVQGFDEECKKVRCNLQDVGFDVLEVLKHDSIDEIVSFLKRTAGGFHHGGTYMRCDALLVYVCGRSDGESVRCGYKTTKTAQVAIQRILDIFEDSKVPSLKGRPKIFVLSLCFDKLPHHPARGNDTGPAEAGEVAVENILRSSVTGGTASICAIKVDNPLLPANLRQVMANALRDEREHVDMYAPTSPRSRSQLLKGGLPHKEFAALVDLGVWRDDVCFFIFSSDSSKRTEKLTVRISYYCNHDCTPTVNDVQWKEAVDSVGRSRFKLSDVLVQVSSEAADPCLLVPVAVEPFSSRYLRFEFSCEEEDGDFNFSLRQIRAYCRSSNLSTSAIEQPSPVPALSLPALLNHSKALLFPRAQVPQQEETLSTGIQLRSPLSLLCYSIPSRTPSLIPQSGSFFSEALVNVIRSDPYKSSLQELLSHQLQLQLSCLCRQALRNYSEEVRVLHNQCDITTRRLFLDMLYREGTHTNSITSQRDVSVLNMSRRSRALLAGNCHVAFNSQECAREFSISADRSIARKLHETSSPIIASTTRLPSDWLHIKITFEIRASPQRPSIGREIRLGLMRERRLDPDFLHSYSLGSDENSWAVSLRSRDVFHLHNNNHTRLAGVHFSDADHISIVLNRQHQTASFSLNDAQQLVCFQGVDERVVPLVSISAPAVCDVAILPCEVW